MRMLFHNWTPPPIMFTKEKLNTYPPLFSNNPLQWRSGLFAFEQTALFYGVLREYSERLNKSI